MRSFYEWLQTESSNEVEWQRLFDHGLDTYRQGPSKDPRFHDNMIRLMRNVGLDQEANELEMVRMSDEDIKFGNTPMYGIGAMTIGAAMNSKAKREKEESFRAAHRAYMGELESIMDIIDTKGRAMGWKWSE